jgi:hypothetical protein
VKLAGEWAGIRTHRYRQGRMPLTDRVLMGPGSCNPYPDAVAPGLAPLTVSDRARARLVERSPSWYLDLRMIGRYTGPATGARTYHPTAPVSTVMSLHAGLRNVTLLLGALAEILERS